MEGESKGRSLEDRKKGGGRIERQKMTTEKQDQAAHRQGVEGGAELI